MIDRRRYFKKLAFESDFLELRKKIQGFNSGLQKGELESIQKTSTAKGLASEILLATASLPDLESEKIDRAVKTLMVDERKKMEKGLTVLATLGSNAPFVGLLGTVLGIIQAFGELAGEKGDTAQVISSISEALVATAIGLFVAIPAVVAYNYFSKEVRSWVQECESLKDLLVSRLRAKH